MWFPTLTKWGFEAYTPWFQGSWFWFTAEKGRVETTESKPHLTSKYSHWSDTHFGICLSFFAFSFSTCDFPWEWAKRNCLASWEESVTHTQMTFPGPVLHRLCAIYDAAGGENQDYPAFSALVSKLWRENSIKRGGLFKDTGQSSIFL